MIKPKILVFASGGPEGGGSGFEKLVEASQNGTLNAEITAVISNHVNGGVRKRADKLKIPFMYFPKPWTHERYQKFAYESGADFFALSGWLKLVTGLDLKTNFNSKTVFNIHPGPLPEFGGRGLHGHHVHEAVLAAFHRGEIGDSAVSMHFVTEEYDRGPVFFKYNVEIYPPDSPDTLGFRVNKAEHEYQAKITNMVVNGMITWDGIDPATLKVPEGYVLEQFED